MKKLLLLFISVFSLVACGSTSDNISVNTEISNPRSIIAIGDSLTIGLGLPTGDNYPSQLEGKLRELGYNYTIENAGISGDTSAGLLSRIDWILDGANPDFVILCIGANDAFQGKSVADIEKNIRAIIEKIQSKNIRLVFAGMKAPFNMGAEYRNQYDTMFPRLAKEYKLEYVPFLLEGVALNQKYNQDDRIHPNREGYTIVVSNIMEILEDSDLLKK
ncbi:arylesterase [Candidatus Gracilibacteria bacterium]|nr:arylesterase [Candidatus Gracilibacteria bacterium]